jgi:hypothetical protein
VNVSGTASVTVAVAIAVCPAALAGGESKNMPPFVRGADRGLSAAVQGEPKNKPPFTRPVPRAPTIVVRAGGGFDWTDAGIGAAAGLGVALAAAGGVGFVRTRLATEPGAARRRPNETRWRGAEVALRNVLLRPAIHTDRKELP